MKWWVDTLSMVRTAVAMVSFETGLSTLAKRKRLVVRTDTLSRRAERVANVAVFQVIVGCSGLPGLTLNALQISGSARKRAARRIGEAALV